MSPLTHGKRASGGRIEQLEARCLLAGTAQLIRDINQSAITTSGSSNVVHAGASTFFVRAQRDYDSELWKTDGTPARTLLVRDIRPGTKSSNPSQLTDVNGALYFTADDGIHGEELWKSDGTLAG